MKLPVTTDAAMPSPAVLWRRYSDLAYDHACAIGDAIDLPGVRGTPGAGAAGRRLPGDVFLPAEPVSPATIEAIFDAYAAAGNVGPRWLAAARADDADATLIRHGCQVAAWNLLRLRTAAASPAASPEILVLPGRAARAAYADWCDRRAAVDPAAALLPRHLDDPQYEAVVALQDGIVVAAAALQTRGETTAIFDVFVEVAARRRGIATALLGRLIDVAARGQAADVFAAVAADDVATIALFSRSGFVGVGQFRLWTAE